MKLVIYTIIIVALTLTIVLGGESALNTFINNHEGIASWGAQTIIILGAVLAVYLFSKLISFLKTISFITKQRKANKILMSKDEKLNGRKI